MRLNLSKFLLLNYKTLDSKLCLSKELVKRNYGVLSLIYSLHHFENFTKKFFYLSPVVCTWSLSFSGVKLRWLRPA